MRYPLSESDNQLPSLPSDSPERRPSPILVLALHPRSRHWTRLHCPNYWLQFDTLLCRQLGWCLHCCLQCLLVFALPRLGLVFCHGRISLFEGGLEFSLLSQHLLIVGLGSLGCALSRCMVSGEPSQGATDACSFISKGCLRLSRRGAGGSRCSLFQDVTPLFSGCSLVGGDALHFCSVSFALPFQLDMAGINQLIEFCLYLIPVPWLPPGFEQCSVLAWLDNCALLAGFFLLPSTF